MDELIFTGQGVYQIKVKGHLDEQWSEWFEGLEIITSITEAGLPLTIFTGPIKDQAALHGVIAKIRDIHLPLISVNPIESETEPRALDKEGENHGDTDST